MESLSRNLFLGFIAVVAVVLLGTATQLFEMNDAGYLQVKQDSVDGDMSVRMDPGMYSQMFANITTYKISDVYDFHSKDEQINVRFNDAATADISGQIKYRLPATQEGILKIHTDFRSDEAVHRDLIRQVVAAALKQTATLFGAEEVYSTRRSDFIYLVNEQIKQGIYATTYTEKFAKDEDGNNFIKRTVAVKSNDKGEPIVSEESAFARYDIELIQLVINDVDFDQKTEELIAKRKEADQEKVVAKANAERAKQDAITAEERGKAEVAKAEAEALVIKKSATIEAEKLKEVAEQQALQAEAEKKRDIAKGQGEAEATRLKVAAGLSPLEKATIEKDTAIGVAEKMANIKLPSTMVFGGGGNNAPMDPFTAVGLKSFIEISKDLTKDAKE